MRNSGQGGFGMPGDLESLSRQAWQAWSDALRQAAPGAGFTNPFAPPAPAVPGVPGMQEALNWWTSLARQHGHPESNAVLDRFSGQAQQWLGMMQQLASGFAGREAGAADVTNAWKQMLGQLGGNPFASVMQGMQGQGLQGFEQWSAQVAPWLRLMQVDSTAASVATPAFGFLREHQERWQALADAQGALQQRMQAYNGLMLQATQDAFGLFERKLAEREEPGRQIESARALFDLWIDAAEEAYATIAMSPEFRKAYGEMVDAQMRVRAGVQREVEHACAQLGMPTRSELDGAHRKIVELERQMRRLRDGMPTAGAPRSGGRARGTTRVAPEPPRMAPVRREEPADVMVTPARESALPRIVEASPKRAKKKSVAAVAVATRKQAKAKSEAKKQSRSRRKGAAPSATTVPSPTPAARKAAKPSARRGKSARKPAKKTAVRKAAQGTKQQRRGPVLLLTDIAMPLAPVPMKRKR